MEGEAIGSGNALTNPFLSVTGPWLYRKVFVFYHRLTVELLEQAKEEEEEEDLHS